MSEPTVVNYDELKKLYAQGLGNRSIAKQLSIGRSTVSSAIRRLRERGELPKREIVEKYRHGPEKGSTGKHAPLDKGRVRALYEAGWDPDNIAFDMFREVNEVKEAIAEMILNGEITGRREKMKVEDTDYLFRGGNRLL